jgi:1,5-anhydro-D-fructose reductase (1,5-anhydro-D-mannitol-forming)
MAHAPIRVGILGTSGHASRVAAPALMQSPHTELIGAAGSAPDRGEAFAKKHGLKRAYLDFAALLRDPDIDAVWICSPNHLHAAQVRECAAAGKHVLVEKPLATSRADAEAAGAAAAKAGVVLQVGCQHRFRPAHQRLHDLVRAGAVGPLGYFRIHRFWRYPYYEDMDPAGPPVWRRSADESGGWIINDIGSHLIDLLLWVAGAQGRTAGAVLASQQFTNVPTEDSTAVLIALDGAGIGIVETSCANESPGSRIEIYGRDGWIRAENTLSGASTILMNGGRSETFEPVAVLDTYLSQVADFAAAVRGKMGIGADAAAGAAVADIIATALKIGSQVRAAPNVASLQASA